MPELIKGEAFTNLFREFARTAWRLEVRRAYGSQSDAAFPRWLTGEDRDVSWFRPWLDLMTGVTGQGKRVERVRLVDDPPSDFLRFEIWLNTYNQAAGEDIRYLERTVAAGLELPEVDFWIFDSRRVAKLHFDDGDEFLGVEMIEDPAVVVQHSAWRDAAWHHAETFDRYVKRTGIGVAEPG